MGMVGRHGADGPAERVARSRPNGAGAGAQWCRCAPVIDSISLMTETSNTPTHVVTGASGFVGRRLAEALRARGDRVVALMRTPAEGPWDGVVTADLGNPAVPALPPGIDTVFHLAGRAHALAESAGDAMRYAEVNTGGTERMLVAAAAAGARAFVLVSTVKVFGDAQQLRDRPLREDDRPRPDTPYGESKLAAERAVLSARAPVHRAVVRPALVYGPGAKGNLARMREAVARGRFPPLAETGNRRSLVHLDDLVAGLIAVAEAPHAAGRVYQATDGEAYSTRRIFRALCAEVGRKEPWWSVPPWALQPLAWMGDGIGALRERRFAFDSAALRKLTESAWFDSSRLREELGWRPEWSLEGRKEVPGRAS